MAQTQDAESIRLVRAGPDDAELIECVASGDRQAAEMLVRRHQSAVRSFLMRLTQRPDLTDDLAQETFLRLLRYADRFDPKYSMRTWLLTIARRLWINHLRRMQHRKGAAAPMDEPTCSQPGPLAVAGRADEQARQRRLLDDALEQLSEPQRTAVVLFHQQELPLQQVAQVMEIPVGTVKSHLHRGRMALRRQLSGQWEAKAP